ncbi:hypothetical protein [Frigoriglobus tundricola]|uniref:DUF4440 domain-containing protein n=1 Tax=Frigoriglobus tundricola TaxID=2774151 RepID=A0A6M5YJB6_9BACT|nr:hypothetical protein [Frigoriglobus tundricola]QJW93366.1 hypothetical protein FTUN_0872 [Frigoriglobus tundricola]
MRSLLVLACVVLFVASVRADDRAPSETVWAFTRAIEKRRWKDAEALVTKGATVTTVPAEAPETRSTQTALAFLGAEPKWCFGTLDYHESVHHTAATFLFDFRRDDLVCRSTFELVKIDGQWKIDSVRIATRKDAKGAAEEIKALSGAWVLDEACAKRIFGDLAEKQKADVKVQIARDKFAIDYDVPAIDLFGGPPSRWQGRVRAWRLRIDPTTKPKSFDLEWDEENGCEGLYGVYELGGDKLTLALDKDPKGRPKRIDQNGLGPIVLKRAVK